MTADHCNEDLRRRSFETTSLQAARFDGADLRGADFTLADLSNASFRNARFGVPPSIGAAILAAAIALSLAFGVVAGFSIDAVRDWCRSDRRGRHGVSPRHLAQQATGQCSPLAGGNPARHRVQRFRGMT